VGDKTRQQTQACLDNRESEQRVKETAEMLPCIICESDLDFCFTYANKRGLETFGYSREEFDRGIMMSQVLLEEDRPRAEQDIKNVLAGDFGNPAEYKLKSKNGKIIDLLVNTAPIIKDGLPCGLWFCGIDVTERKNAQEATLHNAQEAAQKAQALVAGLRKELLHNATFESMVSRSPGMRKIFDILPEIAQSNATVLVLGESGTGKELIARTLHELSPRKKGPFLAINCSALPDTLLESELFGYKAGAFTDAKKDKPGKFALAEGGTLFLDEIGDVSPVVQAKLLRVLQEKTYEPLGATKSVKANVRIVAATNRNLMEMIKKGEFREDLFYRINVLSIKLPPLRERRGDIPLLCSHFIGIYNIRYEKEVKEISKDALDLLLAYDFPGNIRELENIIEHAFVFCKGAALLVEHLPEEFRHASPEGNDLSALGGIADFEKLEKMYLQNILKETGNNKLQAAKRLGIDRSTLFRKMKKLGIS
jgi:PAS domain S-box-containing protein